ncbi:MAG: hypothetical protein ABWX59_11685 [Microbacteriaceae bacterium]
MAAGDSAVRQRGSGQTDAVHDNDRVVADDPDVMARGQRDDVAWGRIHFSAVFQLHVDATGDVVLLVRRTSSGFSNVAFSTG